MAAGGGGTAAGGGGGAAGGGGGVAGGGRAAEGGEGVHREDDLDRHLEVLGQAQREVEARPELAALEVAHRLVVPPERVGELATRDPAFGPQHRDAVVDRLAHRRNL